MQKKRYSSQETHSQKRTFRVNCNKIMLFSRNEDIMGRIIAVANQKGGVGKTTTTTNVGFELARKGYKVLLADLDPQATLTSALGVTDPEETVFSALQGAVDGKETRLPWIRLQENISLCPSCRKMADAEYLLQNEYGRENFLKELAAKTDGGYDFVLLDCPPAVGLITVNALVAATDLIIPVQPEVASLYGLVSILDTVAVIQRKINRGLNLLGMLVTQYDRRTTLHAEILEAMRKQYGETVFSTVISRSIRVAESMSRKTDVVSYSRNSNGAADYRSLTREILSRLNMVDNK